MNNRFAFKFFLVLLLNLGVLGSGALLGQDWVSMSPEGSFAQFKLPGEPKEEVTESPDATTHKYSAEHGEVAYLVSYTLHKNTLSDYESLAEASVDAFNERLAGKIVSQEPWKVKKHTGRKATIQMTALEASCQYRVVLVGQIQYQFIVVAPVGSYDAKTAAKFFKSIKIKQ